MIPLLETKSPTCLLSTALAVTFLLAACALPPKPDPNPLQSSSVQVPQKWNQPLPEGGDYDAFWMTDFKDEQLIALIREGLNQSPDVLARLQTVEAALKRITVAGAAARPYVYASSRAGKRSESDPIESSEFVSSNVFASWEIDLWGRLSSARKEADFLFLSEQAGLDATELSLAGNIAASWISAKTSIERLRIAEENLDVRRNTAKLTQQLFDQGIITALDVNTTRTLLASAESVTSDRQRQLEAAILSLETLVGRYPSGSLKVEGGLPKLSSLAEAVSPSDMTYRRPDLREQEARILALTEFAKQERSRLLPGLTLEADAGQVGTSIRDVLNIDQLVASLAGSLTAPVLQGGRIRAEYAARLAEVRSAINLYDSILLGAFEEVERSISADRYYMSQVEDLAQSIIFAQKAEELAKAQYIAGTAGIFQLIDTQTLRLNANNAYINTQEAYLLNRVGFYIAIGSGLK